MAENNEATQIPEWGDRALSMARGGKSIVDIHEDLKVDWYIVWNHIRKSEGNAWASWQGAKKALTIRLDRLVKEKDRTKREQLVNEAKECANYLYYGGKALRLKIDHALKELA